MVGFGEADTIQDLEKQLAALRAENTRMREELNTLIRKKWEIEGERDTLRADLRANHDHANLAWNNLNFARSVLDSPIGLTDQVRDLLRQAQDACDAIVHARPGVVGLE